MKDSLNIGPAPSDEPCAQLGSPDYKRIALAECQRFIEQIRRHYPEPMGGYLSIARESHDFGVYFEVTCVYETDDEEASQWAYDVEGDRLGVLCAWDETTEPRNRGQMPLELE